MWVWVVLFFLLLAVIISVAFQLMCLADLEVDYINPYDSASRINQAVLPEFIVQGVLCLLYLGNRPLDYVASLLSLLILRCAPKQHYMDVTEIFNQLNWEKRQRLWKLGYLVILFIISLVVLIRCIVEDDDQTLKYPL